jgi:hypothetical protein
MGTLGRGFDVEEGPDLEACVFGTVEWLDVVVDFLADVERPAAGCLNDLVRPEEAAGLVDAVWSGDDRVGAALLNGADRVTSVDEPLGGRVGAEGACEGFLGAEPTSEVPAALTLAALPAGLSGLTGSGSEGG